MKIFFSFLALALAISSHSAQVEAQGNFLQSLLSVFSNGQNSELGGLLSGFFGQNTPLAAGSDSAANPQSFAQLLRTFADTFGFDPNDIGGITRQLRANKEFRDNVDASGIDCAAKKDHQKRLATQKCDDETVDSLVMKKMIGGEALLDHVIADDYEYFKKALILCSARELNVDNRWSDLEAFLKTTEGRRNVDRGRCTAQMGKEKRMCTDAKKVLCAINRGEHLNCRRNTEMSRFNHKNRYFPMESYTVERPLSSLRQVRLANFAASVPRAGDCDGVARALSTERIIAETRRA